MRLAGWRSRQMLSRYGAATARRAGRESHRRLAPGDRLYQKPLQSRSGEYAFFGCGLVFSVGSFHSAVPAPRPRPAPRCRSFVPLRSFEETGRKGGILSRAQHVTPGPSPP